MEFITKGNTQFRVSNFKTWTKEQFISQYKGLVSCDLNDVWNQIELANGTSSESNKAVGKKHERNHSKKVDAVPFPKRGL